MMNKKLTTNIARGIAIIFLAFAIYKTNIDGVCAFIFTMALGIWLFPWSITYLLTAIFGEKNPDYDGVLYIDRTEDSDIFHFSLDKTTEEIIAKGEIRAKVDDMEGT